MAAVLAETARQPVSIPYMAVAVAVAVVLELRQAGPVVIPYTVAAVEVVLAQATVLPVVLFSAGLAVPLRMLVQTPRLELSRAAAVVVFPVLGTPVLAATARLSSRFTVNVRHPHQELHRRDPPRVGTPAA